jgi:hypothetical protein
MTVLMSLAEAKIRYGLPENGRWAGERRWMETIQIPFEIGTNWINSVTGMPTTHIYCNIDISDRLLNSLKNVDARGLIDELKSFDGCYIVRDVRGEPGKISMHSWGMAIDINAYENHLGCTPTISPQLVQCFTDEGAIWGGTFKRKDGMHFQWVGV